MPTVVTSATPMMMPTPSATADQLQALQTFTADTPWGLRFNRGASSGPRDGAGALACYRAGMMTLLIAVVAVAVVASVAAIVWRRGRRAAAVLIDAEPDVALMSS